MTESSLKKLFEFLFEETKKEKTAVIRLEHLKKFDILSIFKFEFGMYSFVLTGSFENLGLLEIFSHISEFSLNFKWKFDEETF